MGTKKLIFLFIFLISGYCYGYDSYRCNLVADTLYGYKWLYKAVGMITQLNHCAIIPGLNIELGDYYSAHKHQINRDVENGGGSALDALGKFVGCSDNDFKDFSKMVIENKEFIFGNGDYQPRTVMLNIYEKIQKNEKLKLGCQIQ